MGGAKKLPLVAICGRPNVGKSTLYNRLTGKYQAIVHGEHGITRDRHYGTADWEGRTFALVDTGGIVDAPIDAVTRKMQEQVRVALQDAKVILFVLDGQEEITRTDEEIRDELFKYGKPVVLAINKLDNLKLEQNSYDFYALGMGEPFPISSGHGHGIAELAEEVIRHLPSQEALDEEAAAKAEEKPVTKVAVVGKPNVGKSSFINAILNEQRTIVDDVPGTTRDSIDIEFHWKGKDYLLIDTAGMRRKAGIKKEVERFSVSRTLRAVRRADVCLVMVDATDGISEQDKRIIGYMREQGATMLMVWTKWDLIEDKEAKFKRLKDELDLKVRYLSYVPFMTVSNVSRQRLYKVFEYIDRAAEQAEKRISTGELNRFIEGLKGKHKPSQRGGKLAKILYATQAGVKPTTFVLFVNQKRLFHFSYLRYIENQLREAFGFEGVPIHIELREDKSRK
ncbi:MAG: ribosome biogenesis GTPase Der [Candidatus Hydrogenedentes bacterium]|jgi:GTP-binding protein|nr:ribosome biogenesis GTPase Der [Candidatus Hydrogenedentota bacterium]